MVEITNILINRYCKRCKSLTKILYLSFGSNGPILTGDF